MAELLKGSVAAEAIVARAKASTEDLVLHGVQPTLALVRVGENSADGAYERGARKKAEAVGVAIRDYTFSESVTQAELAGTIAALNADESVHGILLFRPLPPHLDEQAICNAIDPAKDVDVANSSTLAGLYLTNTTFAPCTAQAVLEILDAYDIPVAGKRVCVVGRSQVVGRPLAALLLARDATVCVCHSKSEGLCDIMSAADIVVCAVGRAQNFGVECFSAGQTDIDEGINWDGAQ